MDFYYYFCEIIDKIMVANTVAAKNDLTLLKLYLQHEKIEQQLPNGVENYRISLNVDMLILEMRKKKKCMSS